MAKEGFFQKIKNFLSGGSEEEITEFSEPEEADVSIQDAEDSDFPTFKFSPVVEGIAEATAELFDAQADVGRETPDLFEQYRQEHEPYRYEPDGDQIVCITKAHLYEVHPKIEGVKMHALTPLQIKADAECVIYTEFDTDEQGHVVKDPDHPQIDNPNFDADDPFSGPKLIDDPDHGVYRLKKAGALPESTHFELPDESNANGKVGKYRFPIVWVKDRKLYRHQWNEEVSGREARLYGSLEGIRGPLHWNCGYNKLLNLGTGKNIYRKYVREKVVGGGQPNVAKDEKELRSIDQRPPSLGQSDEDGNPIATDRVDADGNAIANPPFSGEAQVKVKYNDANQADATEIHITGNDYNKYWKIGGKGVGIVEDGLVTCLTDLTCKDFTPLTLNTTSVLTSSGTTTVLSAGSTTSVAQMPDSSQVASVVSGSAVTTVAAPTTSGDTVEVWNSGTTTNVWSGGTATAGGGLTAVKVSKCGSTDDCVWVLGIDASGSYESSAPTFPAFITGATSLAGITGASFTSVIKSVPTTSALDSSATVNVVKSNLTPVDVVTTSNTVSVVTSGSTVSVYAPTGSASNKTILEAPAGSSANTPIKVVECPTEDGCPASE